MNPNPSQKVQVHPWKLTWLAGETTMNEDVLPIFTWGIFQPVILVFRGVQYSWTWLSFGIVEYSWRYVSNCVPFCLGFVFEASHGWPETFLPKLSPHVYPTLLMEPRIRHKPFRNLTVNFAREVWKNWFPATWENAHISGKAVYFSVASCEFLKQQNADCFRWKHGRLENLNFFGGKSSRVHVSNSFVSYDKKKWLVCCSPSNVMMDNISFHNVKKSTW